MTAKLTVFENQPSMRQGVKESDASSKEDTCRQGDAQRAQWNSPSLKGLWDLDWGTSEMTFEGAELGKSVIRCALAIVTINDNKRKTGPDWSYGLKASLPLKRISRHWRTTGECSLKVSTCLCQKILDCNAWVWDSPGTWTAALSRVLSEITF